MYDTVVATSGEEALANLSCFRPDMLLLDVNMPGMSGYDVCRAVRNQQAFHDIRILLISANMTVEERLRGYNAGADDYIVKPFSPDELRAKVEVFLRLRSGNDLDETKNNLLGLFTHETRTPLGVIIGFSDLLRIDENRDEETRRCAQAIYDSAIGLHRFIEKATLLSRLKGGYLPMLTEGPIDIHLKRIAGRWAPVADERSITVKVDAPVDCLVSVDWEVLDEAIGYIVENAIQFSHKGGSVLIFAECSAEGALIQISDRGRGISSSWISNIFEEFTVRDIRHHQKGQGLSLALVKKVVELHGGSVTVESQLGEGSTFYIRLPRYRAVNSVESCDG